MAVCKVSKSYWSHSHLNTENNEIKIVLKSKYMLSGVTRIVYSQQILKFFPVFYKICVYIFKETYYCM